MFGRRFCSRNTEKGIARFAQSTATPALAGRSFFG
jgi:hypothetical protein